MFIIRGHEVPVYFLTILRGYDTKKVEKGCFKPNAYVMILSPLCIALNYKYDGAQHGSRRRIYCFIKQIDINIFNTNNLMSNIFFKY